MNSCWVKYLPQFLRTRIEERHTLQKIITNTSWLFLDKILRMGVGFFVGVWIARYLGPEQFGLLSFAGAFVALFSVIANWGLDSIVVRDIVHYPACKDEILGTAFVMKFYGGLVTLLLAYVAVWLIRPGDILTHWLVLIIMAGTIFQAFDVIDFWFQSQVLSKYTVYAKNAAFLLATIVKVVLIITKSPLIAFAWVALMEVAIGSAGMVMAYRMSDRLLKNWSSSVAMMKKLVKDSWPLFLSGVFVTILLRIDQVMLGAMLGNQDVGIYAAAVRFSEIWYFIPISIVASVFPAIASARKSDITLYYQRLTHLYLLMIWLSLAVAIPLTIFSRRIIMLLYGNQYNQAATVLAIHCWAGIFIFFGSVGNLWYLLENLNHYTLFRCIVGAVCNVSFNLALIPKYGIKGAAVATVVSQVAASYLFDLLNKRTRVLFRIKTTYLLFFLPITVRFVVNFIGTKRFQHEGR